MVFKSFKIIKVALVSSLAKFIAQLTVYNHAMVFLKQFSYLSVVVCNGIVIGGHLEVVHRIDVDTFYG
jgi:hypothetical protein